MGRRCSRAMSNLLVVGNLLQSINYVRRSGRTFWRCKACIQHDFGDIAILCYNQNLAVFDASDRENFEKSYITISPRAPLLMRVLWYHQMLHRHHWSWSTMNIVTTGGKSGSRSCKYKFHAMPPARRGRFDRSSFGGTIVSAWAKPSEGGDVKLIFEVNTVWNVENGLSSDCGVGLWYNENNFIRHS